MEKKKNKKHSKFMEKKKKNRNSFDSLGQIEVLNAEDTLKHGENE